MQIQGRYKDNIEQKNGIITYPAKRHTLTLIEMKKIYSHYLITENKSLKAISKKCGYSKYNISKAIKKGLEERWDLGNNN